MGVDPVQSERRQILIARVEVVKVSWRKEVALLADCSHKVRKDVNEC